MYTPSEDGCHEPDFQELTYHETRQDNHLILSVGEFIKDDSLPHVIVILKPGKSNHTLQSNSPMNDLQCEV